MKNILILCLFLTACAHNKHLERQFASQKALCESSDKFSLVVHGGVGYMPNDAQKALHLKILSDGRDQLREGKSAQDVVQYVVEQMEDSGIFNAGKGGTRTSLKTVELDASIMDGSTLGAGAVASLKDVKNPIRLARMIKDKTPHVFMVSEGASKKASEFGLAKVTPDYFVSQIDVPKEKRYYGTVGAAAMDRCGNLAAGTSTGGLTGKLPGRVGDSPIIGAGTYANNKTVALSATGEGEKFIRASVGVRVSSIIEYTGRDLKSAMKESLDLVESIGGTGGIIALDKNGNVQWLTTQKMPMPRGYVREDGVVVQRDVADE